MIKTSHPFLVLYTNDIDKTHKFYEAIGSEIIKLEEDKVVVNIGGHEIHFILDKTEPFEEYKYIAKNTDFGNGVIFYIETRKISEVFKVVKAAGGVMKTDIVSKNSEYDEFLFEDPNGFKFGVWGF